MQFRSVVSFGAVLLSAACVDRIDFDIPEPEAYPLAVDGNITDQPGPYYISLSGAPPIGSKTIVRIGISASKITISDNTGYAENLQEYDKGKYKTQNIRGVLGRSYKLRIEIGDGRVYESVPDTLLPSGTVDKVYFTYREDQDVNGNTRQGFDVYFDASAGGNDKYYFLWNFDGIYQVEVPCCTCYAHLTNDIPVVSDGQFVENGQFRKVWIDYVPATAWTLQHKVYAQVIQKSLSRNAYKFWKALKLQKEATASLFQPVVGKIPGNFVQLSGTEVQMTGIFFASAETRGATFIYNSDLPNWRTFPKIQFAPATSNYNPYAYPCSYFIPGATTAPPADWGG